MVLKWTRYGYSALCGCHGLGTRSGVYVIIGVPTVRAYSVLRMRGVIVTEHSAGDRTGTLRSNG